MKILAITQARVGSTRLPGKVLKTIKGESLLEIHLKRLLLSKKISKLIVATTHEDGVEKIIKIADDLNVSVFQGNLYDVLDRFYQAALPEQPDWVVRITSDCPLLDSKLVDEVIDFAIENNLDYASNCLMQTYPDGQDVEVFKFNALEMAWNLSTLNSDREHVTPFIRNHKNDNGESFFKVSDYPYHENLQHIRMTVDEQNDFVVIEKLIEDLGTDKTWEEYVDYILSQKIDLLNSNIIRNEGYIKSIKSDRNGKS